MDKAMFDAYIPASLAWSFEPMYVAARTDMYIVGCMVVFLLVLRPLLDKFVFIPFAWKVTPKDVVKPAVTAVAKDDENKTFSNDDDSAKQQQKGKKQKKKKEDATQAEVVDKFKESAWKFAFYSLSWSLGTFLCAYDGYLTNWSLFWLQYPNALFSTLFRFYYLASLSFYIHSCITLPMETKRDDRTMLMIHHIVTIALIYVSYAGGIHRIGSIILILHDFCDIWLELAKMFNYSKVEIGSNVSFGIFALGWVATRLTIFPAVIWNWFAVYPAEVDPDFKLLSELHHKLYIVFLLSLFVMHIIWTRSIIRVIQKVLKGESAEDVREKKD